MKESDRSKLTGCRRVLVKIGSRALSTDEGLNYRIIERLCDELSQIEDRGCEVALVSSGAIAAGKAVMKSPQRRHALSHNQAFAAIGQGNLIRTYNDAFRRYGYRAAQILITREDLDNRLRYLNIRNTLRSLFDLGVIPVINENDTVSVDEIQFSDNDMLSAMIIPLVEAQAMIILTDTDGVYSSDPRRNPDARRIPEIAELKPSDIKVASDSAGALGRGGMKSKLDAAYHASLLGVPTVIASAYQPQVIQSILDGEDVGTFVHGRRKGRLTQKDHWISFVTRPKGSVTVDRGALDMIVNNGKSLLPCGVTEVCGKFFAGDPLEVKGPDKKVVAVGLSNFTSDELVLVMGSNSANISSILEKDCDEEVIHRNNMILKRS